jgi:hypothetical protein
MSDLPPIVAQIKWNFWIELFGAPPPLPMQFVTE